MTKIATLPWNTKQICFQDGNIVCRNPGPAIELACMGMQLLQQDYSFVIPPDGQWGSFDNGHWTGLLGMVYNATADVTAPFVYPTLDRLATFDYVPVQVLPFYTCFVFNPGALQPLVQFYWWRVFDWRCWLLFGTLVLFNFVPKSQSMSPSSWVISISGMQTVIIVFGQLLLRFYIHNTKLPFSTIDGAAAAVSSGVYQFISLDTSSYKTTMFEDPLFAPLKQATSLNGVQWLTSYQRITQAVRQNPHAFFLGTDYDCTKIRIIDPVLVIHKFDHTVFLPGFGTALLYHNVTLRNKLTGAYRILQELGFTKTVIRRYFRHFFTSRIPNKLASVGFGMRDMAATFELYFGVGLLIVGSLILEFARYGTIPMHKLGGLT